MHKMCRNGHDTTLIGRNASDGRCTLCKRLCESRYQRTDKGKIRNRESQWRKWGIVNKDGSRFRQSDYDRMLAVQNSKCGICKDHITKFSRKFHVDHEHSTGYPRRLLCLQCNAAIAVYERLGSFKLFDDYVTEYNSSKNTHLV
jgi:hypothetical protein